MKLSRHDKILLLEQEVAALFYIIVLALTFRTFLMEGYFYLLSFTLGFVFFFWMIYEEGVHKTGAKHNYFEHTSSYIMLGQTALALQLVFLLSAQPFLTYMFLIISVIMYAVALARISIFKFVFKDR